MRSDYELYKFRVMSLSANNTEGEAVVNDSPVDCQSRRADRSIFSAEKMQDRVVQSEFNYISFEITVQQP